MTEKEYKKLLQTFHRNNGNITQTAKDLGISRHKAYKYLHELEKEAGLEIKAHEGSKNQKIKTNSLPRGKNIRYYLLTSAQNNTRVHAEGLKNLEAYASWLGTCEILVGTYSYNKSSYGAKAVKAGTFKKEDPNLWFDPAIIPYIKDENIELAPGLIWAGTMNILPTAVNPLSGVENLNGRKSNIIPHAKQYASSIASMPDEGNKFNYTTGTITLMNYIQKRAGLLAELNHQFGGLIVCVTNSGDWWVRQLMVDENNNIYDLGPNETGVLISEGKVKKLKKGECVKAITWGDFHGAENREDNISLMQRIVHTYRPNYQFLHDVFSMSSRAKYEKDDFHSQYKKYISGDDNVETEIYNTARKLSRLEIDDCVNYVVPSNHDDHLTYWLNNFEPKKDLKNAKYFYWLQYNLLAGIHKYNYFNILAFALNEKHKLFKTKFLGKDQSFKVDDIECGMHGHLGPDGTRGTTQSLAKLSKKINKGHDHKAAIYKDVFSAGTCNKRMGYMEGPSSHSITHIFVYANGARTLVTVWNNRYKPD